MTAQVNPSAGTLIVVNEMPWHSPPKAGGSCGFLYPRACTVGRSTNQAHLKDMSRLDRLPSSIGDFFRSNASVPQGLILPSSRAPQSAEQKFANKVLNYSPKTTQDLDDFNAQPVEFYNRQPVLQEHALKLLSNNIDPLLDAGADLNAEADDQTALTVAVAREDFSPAHFPRRAGAIDEQGK